MPENANTIRRRKLTIPPERVWELWTTAQGVEAWWAPDGF